MQKNYNVGKYILDNYQMDLLNKDENSLVIAGAGAGKTLTIIGKVKYLLENNYATPEEILIISFTNVSVTDLKNKIPENVTIFTFHKLAMDILEKANITYTLCNPYLLNYIIEESIKTCSKDEQKLILKFLKLNYNFSYFLKSNAFFSFCQLIQTFINIWKTNNMTIQDFTFQKYSKLEKKIILFIFNIYQKYLEEKNSTKSFDFDDLIIIATNISDLVKFSYKYIIIDEFQDTSLIRLNLIKKIYQNTNAKIIVVGDDWQSIYRFSGCDLNIFLNFKSYFPKVNTIKLVNTYRNSLELITIASRFILKNPQQIQKSLLSSKHQEEPIIFCPYKDAIKKLKQVLNKLLTLSNDIIILARNTKDIYQYIDYEYNYQNNILKYKDYEIKYYTVHKAKGLEAEYVIILNCNNNILGFPNKIENHSLINKIFPQERMKYAEERRLFYVALTRAKEKTYLLYEKNNASIFIKELKKISKKILHKIIYFL